MKNMAAVSGLLLGVLALSSCATLDKDECMTADWYSIGFEDGSKGRAENYLSKHRKACAKHGVTPDFNQYSQGHNRGTDSFCTPDRALRMAADGSQFPQGCATDTYEAFAVAFGQGEQVYAAKLAVEAVEQALHDVEYTVEELQQQIAENEAAIVSDATTQEARRQLLDDNRALQLEIDALHAEHALLLEHSDEKDIELRQLLNYYGLSGLK